MISFLLTIRIQVLIVMPLLAFLAIRDLLTGKKIEKQELGFSFLLGSIYLLYPVFLLFTPSGYSRDVFSMMERQSSLLLIPFVFTLLKNETRLFIYQQRLWFVFACIVSCFAGNLLYLFDGGLTGTVSHVSYRLFFEKITSMHPTYMGLFITFSIALLMTNENWNASIKGWVKGLIYLVLFVFLFALLPKSPIVALLVILSHFFVRNRKNKQILQPLMVSMATAVLVAFLLPTSAQRINEFTALTQNGGTQNVIDNSVNMRKLIWMIDTDLLKENWVWGIGPGKLNAEIFMQYFNRSISAGFPLGYYDTHNQYIFFWLCFGLLGITLFLFMLIIQFWKSIKHNNDLYLYLLILLTITFFTENVLSRQHGVIFYSVFTSLLFFLKNADYGIGKQLQRIQKTN